MTNNENHGDVAKFVPVLMYHDIGHTDSEWCVTPENFRQQIEFLKNNGYKTGGSDKSIIITFDDGREGVFKHAAPILEELGMSAVLFVVSDWVEGKNIPPEEKYSKFMSWEQIKDLKSKGFIIGCHTKTHCNLVNCDKLKDEIIGSKEIIESQTGVNVVNFCYPYGKFNDKVQDYVVKAGFENIMTTETGVNSDKYKLHRQWIMNNTKIEDFSRMVQPTVSLCIIAKDEGKNLGKCLASIAPEMDEIIVTDTGSSDNTKEIATKFGAKIFDFKWVDDFSKARNECIQHAKSDWILVLDADEIIKIEDIPKLKRLMYKSDIEAFNIVTRNYSKDSTIPGWRDGWHPSEKVRLFRNRKSTKFQGIIHELVESTIKGKILSANFHVHHYGFSGVEKKQRYLELGRKKAEMQNDAHSFFQLGVQNKELGKFTEAINAFGKAVEVNDKLDIVYYNRGVVYSKIGDISKALIDYDKALELNNKFSDAHFGKGTIHLKIGDLGKAEVDFKNAVIFNNKNSVAYLNLGSVYERKKEHEKAIMMIVKSITLNPRNSKAFHNLGVVFSKMGKYEKAKIALEQALKLGYDKQKIETMLKELDRKQQGGLSYAVGGTVDK